MPASTYLNRTHEVAKQLDEMQQCRRDARQISRRSEDFKQKSGGLYTFVWYYDRMCIQIFVERCMFYLDVKMKNPYI